MASDKDRAKNLESYAHSVRKQLDDCRAELEELAYVSSGDAEEITRLRAELAAAKEALSGILDEIDDCSQPSDWEWYEKGRTALRDGGEG